MITPLEMVAALSADSFSAPVFGAVMLVKATVVLAAGAIAARAVGRTSPAGRHTIWALTLAGALGLPLGMMATPAWRVRVLPGQTTDLVVPPASVSTSRSEALPSLDRKSVNSLSSSTASLPARGASVTNSNESGRTFLSARQIALLIPILWILGALAVLGWMVVGRISLTRLTRRADSLQSNEWKDLLDGERARAGVRETVRLLSSTEVSTPLTWGIRSPVVLLPAEASEWKEDHRAVVLRHELAHIARSDSLTQALAGVTCAVYWFHPLAWVAARGLRAEQERACDDRVISSGTPAADYAAHLLEVARSARALGAQGLVSLAMARPSQLEGRLLAVLNASRRKTTMSPAMKTIGMAMAIVTFIALSAFRPLPRVVALPRVVVPTIIAAQIPAASSAILDKTAAKWNAVAPKATFDSSFDKTVDARDGGTLVLDLQSGAGLTITGWDQSRVRVSGTLGGRDWRYTDVSLEPTNGGARLVTRQESRGNSQSTSHHFNIWVPKHFNIRLSSGGGGVTISDVSGAFTGTTGGGAIRIERASGSADLHTGGGNIRVTGTNLSGSVETGGGSVYIQNESGDLEGHSGSGPIVYGESNGTAVSTISASGRGSRDSYSSVTVSSGGNVTIDDRTGAIRAGERGPIMFRKSGGGVDLGEAMTGADIRTGGGGVTIGRTGGIVTISTGGGDVSIGRSSGTVSASTGGGDITLGPVAGSASASTGRGDVSIELEGNAAHAVNVISGTGKVVLILPANLSADLDLETAYTDNFGRRTRIISDWPLQMTETNSWDDSRGTPRKYVRTRQSIGRGGNIIRVRTVNGDIIVQRAR